MLGMLAGAALRSLLLAGVVGTALRLRRTCNPRVSLAAWLSMPMATRLASIALPHGLIQVEKAKLTQEIVTRTNVASVMSRAERGVSVALRMVPDCYWLASLLYLAVFSALMLRLLAGLSLSWRIVRRARPCCTEAGYDGTRAQCAQADALSPRSSTG
jgi:hypothetical protein